MLRVAAFLFLILCEHPTLKAWPEFSDELQAVKAVRQNYHPTEEVLSLLEDFRCMVSDCVRIGLRENLTSMKSLSLSVPPALSLRRSDLLSPHRHQQGRRDTAELPKGAEEESECEGSLRHQALAHGLLRFPCRPPPRKGTGQEGRIHLHRPKRPHIALNLGSHPEVSDAHRKRSEHQTLKRNSGS